MYYASHLSSLRVAENPVCFEEGYRVEVLVALRRLERLDQDVYIEDERQEAEEVHLYFYFSSRNYLLCSDI